MSRAPALSVVTVLAPNPGPMTLTGTNTYLLSGDDEAVVVDPGPADPGHRAAVLAAAAHARVQVTAVVLTHGHVDHSEGAPALARALGVGVRSLDPAHRRGGEGLRDGDVIDVAGRPVQVVATPGHSGDSVSLTVPDDSGNPAAVLTGDTILGSGTTVVAHPDGVLADYLASLRRLRALEGVALLPGHGPALPDAGAAARRYLEHRADRLEQVRAALDQLDPDCPEPDTAVVEIVYADVDPVVWPAARLSVRAQLDYLGRTPAGGWPSPSPFSGQSQPAAAAPVDG